MLRVRHVARTTLRLVSVEQSFFFSLIFVRVIHDSFVRVSQKKQAINQKPQPAVSGVTDHFDTDEVRDEPPLCVWRLGCVVR